jgi:DNA anti-recombination protein RmuC
MAEQNVSQQEIMNALGALAKAAVGAELAALRQSVASLETSLSQRLGKLENDTSAKVAAATAEAVAGLTAARQEISAQLEELRQETAKAEKGAANGLAGFQSRLEKAMGEMEQTVQKASEHASASMTSARDALQKDLAGLSQEVGQQFEAIESRFGSEAQARAALEKEQWRVSTLLGTFARAFSGSSDPAEASPQPGPSQAPRHAPNPKAGQPRQEQPGKGDPKPNTSAIRAEDLPEVSEISSSLDKLFEPE